MISEKAKLTFLGTGTSQGIPIIGCRCAVCSSSDKKDKRLRAAALVEYMGLKILVDAGPDFRAQMLEAGVSHLDAILLTHNHRDHTGGLDDVRALNYIDKSAVNIYCEQNVFETLKFEYPYAFEKHKYPGAPEWNIRIIDERPFFVPRSDNSKKLVWVHNVGYGYLSADGSIEPSDGNYLSEASHNLLAKDGAVIIPIRGYHSSMPVLGFRFGQIAYITDMSSIPESEFSKLKDLEHLSLNTVGYAKHHSHFSLDEALSLADRIRAKNTWLTHLSHTFPVYNQFCKELKRICKEKNIRSSVLPAFDGLIIK